MKAWIESLDAASKGFAERRMTEHVARAMQGRRVDELVEPGPPRRGPDGEG